MVLKAHLGRKVGQGHSMSTTFINLEDITLIISMSPSPASLRKIQYLNLEDITLNISMPPSSASLRKIQLKLMELYSKQG